MQASTQPQISPPPETPTSVTIVGADGKTQSLAIPHTRAEIEQLRIRRRELTDQLSSVTARRRGLSQEIQTTADETSRTGLQARLKLLDQRILQLETDVAATGQQISAAPADLMGSMDSESSRTNNGDSFESGVGLGVTSALMVVGVYAAWRRWRRGRRGGSRKSTALSNDSARLERLEQGIEAIAIEVERISEGQRFVTKLFSESQAPVAVANRIGDAGRQ